MRWRIPITASLALLVAVGCDRSVPTEATEAAEAAAVTGSRLSADGQPVAWAVTGSGKYVNNVGNRRSLSFQVRRMSDGSVHGVFQLVGHAQPPNKSHGRLTCLSVVGNEAWIGGVYEKSSNSDLIGREFGFYVKDNGEGNAADPDLLHRHVRNDDAAGWCLEQRDVSDSEQLWAIEAGNIQIHVR